MSTVDKRMVQLAHQVGQDFRLTLWCLVEEDIKLDIVQTISSEVVVAGVEKINRL